MEITDVLEYLYKNDQPELAKVVIEQLIKIKPAPLNLHNQYNPRGGGITLVNAPPAINIGVGIARPYPKPLEVIC